MELVLAVRNPVSRQDLMGCDSTYPANMIRLKRTADQPRRHIRVSMTDHGWAAPAPGWRHAASTILRLYICPTLLWALLETGSAFRGCTPSLGV